MNVVRAVAVSAATAKLYLSRQRLTVAGITGHRRVCALQRIAGLGIVIKLPLCPVDRVMA